MAEEEELTRPFLDRTAVYLKEVSTKYYGEKLPSIHGINIRVERGEFAIITGPNGAGKTTLIETALGLLPRSSGEVVILGKRIPEEGREVLNRVSYVPQDFIKGQEEPFTALQVVLMGLSSKKGVFSSFSNEEIELGMKALREVGMEDHWERPIGKLSGGQQQRVYIARALIRKPDVFFLDEPFSNVDQEWQRKIVKLLLREQKRGASIIVVTHYPLRALKPDLHIKMRGGKIIAIDRR